MEAFFEPSDEPGSASPRGPVFVDASGRRLRRVKLIGLGALGLVAGYVVLLLVAFSGGSNIAAPFLPLPAPAAAPAADDLPSSASASEPASRAPGVPAGKVPSAEPAAPAASEAPVVTPSAVPAASPNRAASPAPAAPSNPAASPAKGAASKHETPSTPVSDPAVSTESSPGKSGEAPGQTRRPSTPAHP